MMNLFDKELDLIHRITNLILILWFVIALFLTYINTMDLIVRKPLLTYKEYNQLYCTSITDNDECKANYSSFKSTDNNEVYYKKKNLIYSIGNVVIVGTSVFILNRKRKLA